MPRFVYYVASSLDGYIAGPGDDISWLLPPPDVGDYSFEHFMAGIGAVVMGRGTWDFILGMDEPWPFGETPVYVVTSRPLGDVPPSVVAWNGGIDVLAEKLRAETNGDVWLEGGGRLVSAFAACGALDDLMVAIQPALVGQGAPLFAWKEPSLPLRLRDVQTYGEMVLLRYSVQR